jgi:Ca2+-binding RTX toxin-like protein
MVGNSGVRFTIEGEGGNDLLIGGNNDDTFNGGDGNDSFLGGKGFNEVTGGAGADRFGFRPEDDVFVITDFEQGVDQLILVNFAPSLTFDALTQGGFVFEDGNDLVIGTGSKGYILENTQLSDWSADDLGFLTI